ncbi:secreted RxLR effector protein 161-like [Pistacia vera]|uniref:secreted RxLR effector protein 161-like n=1 Tax=Pistacia vera TaxID=55513 RepID=UPI001263627D|nr:secreted RxLR effector protein 161-like [Pistacia vera]
MVMFMMNKLNQKRPQSHNKTCNSAKVQRAEPESFEEAINSKDKGKWWAAMKEEMNLLEIRIWKKGTSLDLVGFVDFDFAVDKNTMKSTTSYYFTLEGNYISWKSQLQPIVALSSIEVEYIAVANVFKEAVWLKGILSEANLIDGKVTIYSDNQSAIHLSKILFTTK